MVGLCMSNPPKYFVNVGERFGRLTVIEIDLRMPPKPKSAAKGWLGYRAFDKGL